MQELQWAVNVPILTISQLKEVAAKYREVIPVYIKDYVNLERFAAWASTPLSLTMVSEEKN